MALEKRYTQIQEELAHATKNLTEANEELDQKEKALHSVSRFDNLSDNQLIHLF